MKFLGRSFLILTLVFSHGSYAYQEDTPLVDYYQEQLALSIMEKVRCLVCKGQTVKDSDAKVAKTLRILIRQRVNQGASEEEIRREITGLYGDWVYTDPQITSGTLILWLGPFGALVVLFLLIGLKYRKAQQQRAKR